MESATVGRLSQSVSPVLLPPAPASSPLIPFVKADIGDEMEFSLKPNETEMKRAIPDKQLGQDDVTVKLGQTDSEASFQFLTKTVKTLIEKRNQQPYVVALETTKNDDDADAIDSAYAKCRNGTRIVPDSDTKTADGRIATNISCSKIWPTNASVDETLQQASVLSQRAVATMLALHNMQQQPAGVKDLGNLLPPPPGLLPQTCSSASYHTLFALPHNGDEMDQKIPSIVSATSISNGVHAPKLNNVETSNADVPLDLSVLSAGKKRCHSTISNSISSQPDIKRIRPQTAVSSEADERKIADGTSLASIQSNFPTLLNNRNQGQAAQQAVLLAHIENGLNNDPLPAKTGPFTSLYQHLDGDAGVGGKTLNELVQGGVPPLRIQQWLLAAVSAQKWQQLALNRISLLRQKRQSFTGNENLLKDHEISSNGHLTSSMNSLLPHSGVTFSSALTTHTVVNQLTPGTANNFPSTNRKSPKNSSSAVVPVSAQSQLGKRYRRYAKPPYSYVSLITLSILSSRGKKLRLSQILKRIAEMFPFFTGPYQGWRDSVRHNLSQNECFVKVLKNPYRPTAKGNFWTVNLNSIPHELLLRQNTLVSRYAQDSGYRYRKDLSEVFDMRSGALKVPMPRHLLRDLNDPVASALFDDPAAIMEAIILEETSRSELGEQGDCISPCVRQFSLEDLFNQNEESEDDSLLSGRCRSKPASQKPAAFHSPTLPPRSFSPFLYQYNHPSVSLGNGVTSHNDVVKGQNLSIFPQMLLSPTNNRPTQVSRVSSDKAPNPFAAIQTALLNGALSTAPFQLGLDNHPALQKMLHTNQMLQRSFTVPSALNIVPANVDSTVSLGRLKAGTNPGSIQQYSKPEMEQNQGSDVSCTSRRNKRKGIQPVRHVGNKISITKRNEADKGSFPLGNSSHTIPNQLSDFQSRIPPVKVNSPSNHASSPRHIDGSIRLNEQYESDSYNCHSEAVFDAK